MSANWVAAGLCSTSCIEGTESVVPLSTMREGRGRSALREASVFTIILARCSTSGIAVIALTPYTAWDASKTLDIENYGQPGAGMLIIRLRCPTSDLALTTSKYEAAKA